MKSDSKKPLNILVVEDDPISRTLLEGLFSEASMDISELTFAESLETATAHLNEHSCDVVLLDLNLPDSAGLDTLKSITDCENDAAIVVITGDYDDDIGLEAVTLGAQEYLVKGRYDAYILGRTINYAIERKRSEELLRKKENQYRTLVENLPQRILLKDKDSVFVSCNESYAHGLDMTCEEIAGKTDYDIYAKESADRYRAMDKEVMESRIRKDDYVTYIEKGKEKIIHVTKTPVTNEKDELVGVLCIFENVTKQKHAEKEAKLAYENLQDTHKELKNAQSQIIQNEKMASIGELAAGVAHEMNTPIGFVVSNFCTLDDYMKKIFKVMELYEQLAQEVAEGGKLKRLELVEDIRQAKEALKIDFILNDIRDLFEESKEGLDRITNIVKNLRDFSRIDQVEDFDEHDLNSGIEATLVVARNEIKYDCNIITEFSELPTLFCNSGQINQVFLNILVNAAQAIKMTEREDMGNITIRTYATAEEVICEISDDGPGIPPDKLSKIFDPFFTTKPVGKGTGLGLSVSYDIIVNKHNGELLVDSTVGKGTAFTMKLPIKQENKNEKKELGTDEKEYNTICG